MGQLDNQVEYWNRVATSKQFTHPIDGNTFSKLVSSTARILDLGCGYGRVSVKIRDLGFPHIIGIDSSQEMVKRGKAQHPDLDLRVAEGSVLPFENGAFDVVVLFAVLTCIPTDEGQRACIEEISRVLASEGLLYVSDYWLQSDVRNVERYRNCHEDFGVYGVFRHDEGVICRHHERSWIRDLLSHFEHGEFREIELGTMNGNSASGFQFFGRRS